MADELTPKHGDKRNHHWHTEPTTYVTAHVVSTDEPILIPQFGASYTQSERWCVWCNEWVVTKGIMGGMFCPQCKHGWYDLPTAENALICDECKIVQPIEAGRYSPNAVMNRYHHIKIYNWTASEEQYDPETDTFGPSHLWCGGCFKA